MQCLEARLPSWEGLPSVAVIGPGTAEALRSRGVEPALVAGRSTQEGLMAELRPLLAAHGRPSRILFAGAAGARDLLARELEADFIPLYRTVEERPAAFPEADLVVLASASAARAFAALELDRACVSIGPVTSAEARRLGLRVAAEAASQDAGRPCRRRRAGPVAALLTGAVRHCETGDGRRRRFGVGSGSNDVRGAVAPARTSFFSASRGCREVARAGLEPATPRFSAACSTS